MRVRTRWLLILGLVALTVVVVLIVPVPTPQEIRDGARGLGPWAPLAFLLLHAVVTTTPLPRTVFTLSAGLMFGPGLGLALCLAASTASAVLGFAVARRLGGRAVQRLGPGRVRDLEHRIAGRGLLAVTSTRLVPAIPFAPLNYTFGVTTVRWWPYVLGTAVGLLPGTTTTVLLGDAVTGGTSPLMLVLFLASGTVGLGGLVLAARRRPAGGSAAA